MLEIEIAREESYDEESERFIVLDSFKVRLEHSLVSVSKWESFWKEAFLGSKKKTPEQIISYVKMMILSYDLTPEVFQILINKHLDKITAYIEDSNTATTIYTDPNAPAPRETVTSELIYYWMISLNVPVEFQHWHLNRLLTLIRVINLKNTPKKKMSNMERRNLNRQRLQQYKTKG